MRTKLAEERSLLQVWSFEIVSSVEIGISLRQGIRISKSEARELRGNKSKIENLKSKIPMAVKEGQPAEAGMTNDE